MDRVAQKLWYHYLVALGKITMVANTLNQKTISMDSLVSLKVSNDPW